eukprot:5625-Eustigmatos_ZCMA.PRE.1
MQRVADHDASLLGRPSPSLRNGADRVFADEQIAEQLALDAVELIVDTLQRERRVQHAVARVLRRSAAIALRVHASAVDALL